MSIIRAKFKKGYELKYIGHLDLTRVFKRAFMRANIPVEYSKGFNPQPKLSFATALSLGVASEGEYLDIELAEKIDINDFISKVNNELPIGIKIIKAKYIDDKKTIGSLIRWGSYIVELHFLEMPSEERITKSINEILDKEELIVTKLKKNKKRKGFIKKEVDVRDLIKEINFLSQHENTAILKVMIKTGSVGNLKPNMIIDIFEKYTELEVIKEDTNIQRLELFIEDNENLRTPI